MFIFTAKCDIGELDATGQQHLISRHQDFNACLLQWLNHFSATWRHVSARSWRAWTANRYQTVFWNPQTGVSEYVFG